MTAVPSTVMRLRTPLLAFLALVTILAVGAGHAVAKPRAKHRARHRAPACTRAGRRSRSRTRCHAPSRKLSHPSAHRTPARTTKRTTPAAPKKTPAPARTTPSAPTTTTKTPISATKAPTTTTALTTTAVPTATLGPTVPPISNPSPQAMPFAPTSVWNQALPSDAALDPQSSTYVSGLLSQISSAGLWMNTYQYSTPVFTVSAGQPTVTVKLDTASSPQATALRQAGCRCRSSRRRGRFGQR